MPGALDIVLDNPILTKHARSRLRRNRVIPWSIVIVTLCGIICWAFYQINGLLSMTPLTMVIMLQVITLVFAGGAEIGSAVGGTRESGILDFHRVSPVPPLWLAVGFFLGAPLLEYWLTLLTLPFAIFLTVVGPSDWKGLLAFEVPLVMGAWLMHAITLLGAMVSKKPKAGGRGFIGLIVVGLFLGQGMFFGIQGLLDLSGRMARVGFFGLQVPWMLLLAVYEAVLVGFLFVPSVRRMRSDRVHLYTKRQAIAFLATLVVMALGVLWNFKGAEGLVVGLTYGVMVVAILLTSTITPDRDEYIKGLRRAERDGRRRPSPWSDAGVNRIPLFVICAIALVGVTVCWEAIVGRDPKAGAGYSLSIAVGVLTIAYTGLGLQAAQLFMKKHGPTLFALFIFFAWLVPLIVGGGLGAADFEPEVAMGVTAVSPLAGVLAAGDDLDIPTDLGAARISAVATAVTFAFLFHFLLDVVQRRLDRAVRGSDPRRTPDPFDDVFGAPVREEKKDAAGARPA